MPTFPRLPAAAANVAPSDRRGAADALRQQHRQRPMSDPLLLPCRVTLADGTAIAGAYPPAAHTRAFLRAVVAHQEHVAPWVEVPRGARIDGDLRVARWPRENFHDPTDHAAILAHIERHASRGQELFCGIVPKTEPEPRKEAAQAGRVVWVDIDRKSPAPPPTLEEIERLLDPEIGEVASDALVAAARLVAMPARPYLVALSGSGGAHGYWRIEQTLAAEWIERANVRLINHLGDGADYASFDRNRVMRVPGTRKLQERAALPNRPRRPDVARVRRARPRRRTARPARRRPARAEAHPAPPDGAVATARHDRRPGRPVDAARVLRRAVQHHRVQRRG